MKLHLPQCNIIESLKYQNFNFIESRIKAIFKKKMQTRLINKTIESINSVTCKEKELINNRAFIILKI